MNREPAVVPTSEATGQAPSAPDRDARAPRARPFWFQALRTPAEEFPLQPLPVVHGRIPAGLRGRLYLNGPGRQRRGTQTTDHWFDGDGAVLHVAVGDGQARGTYRYVKTETYLAEEKAGRYLYPGLATLPRDWAPWRRSVLRMKHAANTSVLPLPHKVLALWEGSHPYALDPHTLETRGIDDLGFLRWKEPFPAHPRFDPQTGELFGFNQVPARPVSLNLFVTDANLRLLRRGSVRFGRPAFVHDIVVAGPYLVILVPPIAMDLLPAVAGQKAFFDCLRWEPARGTEVLVIDRHDLSLRARFAIDPFFCWHFGSMHPTPDGLIEFTVVRYDDFPANFRWYRQLATGNPTEEGRTRGYLHRLVIDPAGGRLVSADQVAPLACEFPTIDNRALGARSTDVYVCGYPNPQPRAWDMLNRVARVDPRTGALDVVSAGDRAIVSEPLHAADRDDRGQGWVLNMVRHADRDESEIWISHARRLSEGPVAILRLPRPLPPAFHGAWQEI